MAAQVTWLACAVLQAMRRAVNTTCQGSAADVVKGSMLLLAAQLRATGLGRHCRMLLQVSRMHARVLAKAHNCMQ
jgi:DNA polymerase I-like protein with 3'-5' exonuclease and polymerase domains